MAIFCPQGGKSRVEIYGAGLGLAQPPSVTKSGNRRLSSYRTRQCFQNVLKLQKQSRSVPQKTDGKILTENLKWAWLRDLRNASINLISISYNAFRIGIWPFYPFSVRRCNRLGCDMRSTKDIEGLPYTIWGFSALASYSTWHQSRLWWAIAMADPNWARLGSTRKSDRIQWCIMNFAYIISPIP